MGLSASHEFVDVLAFDGDVMGAMVPSIQQCRALIFLYPLSKVQPRQTAPCREAEGVFFLKQAIENACGSIALIHVLANCRDLVVAGSPMALFVGGAASDPAMSSAERGRLVEANDEFRRLHASSSSLGQTGVPEAAAHIDMHFVALVEHGGRLYELNGALAGPICHGPVGEAGFFAACCGAVTRVYLEGAEDAQFTALALVPHGEA